MIKALGVDIGKATPALKGQVEAWLESNGWEFKGRQRVNGALESGVYFRPAVWPPELEAVAEDWTRQDDARPEPEGSRPDDLPPLPAGLGDQSSAWPGDYEPF